MVTVLRYMLKVNEIKTLPLESAVAAWPERNLLGTKVNISEICTFASGLRADPSWNFPGNQLGNSTETVGLWAPVF